MFSFSLVIWFIPTRFPTGAIGEAQQSFTTRTSTFPISWISLYSTWIWNQSNSENSNTEKQMFFSWIFCLAIAISSHRTIRSLPVSILKFGFSFGGISSLSKKLLRISLNIDRSSCILLVSFISPLASKIKRSLYCLG